MGLDIRGGPSSDGWASCKVFKSDERSPSAGVNLTGEHPHRGRYKCFTGECENLSFFEFCVRAGRFPDWKEARNHFRQQLGIKAPTGKKKPPQEKLVFRDYNENLVRSWCTHKPPIVPWAVRIAGGQITGYPATNQKFTCIAIPVFGPHGADDDPVGYQIYNKSGRTLPVFQGKGQPARQVKIKTVEGSEAGWMNRYALGNLATAEIVWKVEGPADMLALQSVIPAELLTKHLVVTNSSGTGGLLSDEHLDLLAGKVVYVLHDCDVDGQAGGSKWAEALSYICPEVRHVRLPYEIEPNHGKDLRDWLIEGHGYQELLELAAAADVVKRPTEVNETGEVVEKDRDPLAMEKLILTNLCVEAIGEFPDGTIKLFSRSRKKESLVSNVNRLTRTDLIQLVGEPAKQHVFEGSADGGSPSQYHINAVREAIAMLAGKRRIIHQETRGPGCWLGDDSSILVVGSGQLLRWDGAKAEIIDHPFVSGQHIDLSRPEKWCDFDWLANCLNTMTAEECQSPVIELIDQFEKFNWRHSGMHIIAAGLVLATYVQTIWPWRPMATVNGESGSAKSTFFELLKDVFSSLAILASKCTEAGVRQAVANAAWVLLLDEFENDRHRQQILDLLRTSSNNSVQLRGTQDHRGVRFGLRHIVWTAAIESGLFRQPDMNRFLNFELQKLVSQAWIDLPPKVEREALGKRLLASAVYCAPKALQLNDQLRRVKIPGVDSRVIDNLAVAAAMLTVAGVYAEANGEDILVDLATKIRADQQVIRTDHETLMRELLSKRVMIEKGQFATVAEILLHKTSSDSDCLAQEGVSKVEVKGQEYLFIAHDVVRDGLLRGTVWKDQRIDQLLGAMEGAETGKDVRHRISGVRQYGLRIPWYVIDREFLAEDKYEGSEGTQQRGGDF